MIRLVAHVGRIRSELLFAATVAAVLAFPTTRADGAGGDAPDAGGSVGIVVRLVDPPVARYRGGVAGFAPTSVEATGRRLDPRSRAVSDYRARLADEQDAFVSAVRALAPPARVLHQYQMVLNGVALRVPAGAVDAIAALPGVAAVYPDRSQKITTERSPAFVGATTAWRDLGGQATAGEGVIVGVLDTGIWPEHPSFSDPDPAGNAYPPPGPRACQFDIGPRPGPAFACNNKLIGAYRFMAAYDACAGAGECPMSAAAFSSARDENGHGTHTASTAAGNGNVPATLLGAARGKVSGIAPRAYVIAYKVCGEDGNCFESDSAAAVQQAILDGVDVINFSVGGGTAPYADIVELAFLDAYAAGIFVAASAGNSGPFAETVEHRGPWVTTVAASTQKRQFTSTLTLRSSDGAKLKVKGASVHAGIAAPLPFVQAAFAADPFCENATPDGAFLGKVVLCEVGEIPRLQKSFNVAQRGGAAMVLSNIVWPQVITSENHTIPTIHLDAIAGSEVVTFPSIHPDVTASFGAGTAKGGDADRVANFSSRGGPLQPLGASKPDITAPGVQILAGHTPDSVTPTDVDDQLFRVLQGTSMSSPHVAGAAALLRALHPSLRPGQIKSALMTLASTRRLFDEDGTTRADPFDLGAGRLALRKAADVVITFDATAAEFQTKATHLWDANLPSLYVPNLASTLSVVRTIDSGLVEAKTLKTKVEGPDDLVVTVAPTITVPAGGNTSFAIGVDVTAVPEGEVRHAAILFSGAGPALRFPITVRKITGTTTLYGGNGGAANPGALFVLDQAVGSATLVGDPVTPGWLTGIAFTSTGALYGTTNEGGPSNLLRIDPGTGAVLGSTPVTELGGPVAIADLAAQPGTDILYGVRWNGDGAGLAGRLYTIDQLSGVATLVGDTGTCFEGGLAFGPDGTLYFTGFSDCTLTTPSLHVLDPATGAIVSSRPADALFDCLAVRPTDGAIFAARNDFLSVIDPATGTRAFWGQSGTGVFGDIAFR